MRSIVPLLVLAGCALLPSADPGEVCGDGEWTPLEICDPRDPLYGAWCLDDCTWNTCGDGVVGPDEQCDDASDPTCADNCQPVGCGNGAVDPGELCLSEVAVLTVGLDAADLALGDVDGDGDLDVLVARPSADGVLVWFNDGGRLERTATIPTGPGGVAVATIDQAVLVLRPDALTVAFWNGVGHTIVDHPFSEPAIPMAGSLSAGHEGLLRYAAFTTADGAWTTWLGDADDWDPPRPSPAWPGATAALAIDKIAGGRFWYANPELPQLDGHDYPDQPTVALPQVALGLSKPAERVAGQVDLVARTDGALHVIGGYDVTYSLPAPGVVDGTAAFWDAGRLPADIDAVYLDHEGLAIRLSDGTVLRGPGVPGLTDLEVADLDGDGFLDVLALRPVSGEVHVWRNAP